MLLSEPFCLCRSFLPLKYFSYAAIQSVAKASCAVAISIFRLQTISHIRCSSRSFASAFHVSSLTSSRLRPEIGWVIRAA